MKFISQLIVSVKKPTPPFPTPSMYDMWRGMNGYITSLIRDEVKSVFIDHFF